MSEFKDLKPLPIANRSDISIDLKNNKDYVSFSRAPGPALTDILRKAGFSYDGVSRSWSRPHKHDRLLAELNYTEGLIRDAEQDAYEDYYDDF